MTMRTLRRRLNPDAVYRASVKSDNKKHQRKFMSRIEKWASDLRHQMQVLDAGR